MKRVEIPKEILVYEHPSIKNLRIVGSQIPIK